MLEGFWLRSQCRHIFMHTCFCLRRSSGKIAVSVQTSQRWFEEYVFRLELQRRHVSIYVCSGSVCSDISLCWLLEYRLYHRISVQFHSLKRDPPLAGGLLLGTPTARGTTCADI